MAVALATRALENGFSVNYYHVDECMHQPKPDGELHPAQLKNRKYMASNLLVLDEFGCQTMSREEANLLFRVVNLRYQIGSTIITTNKGIASWPGVLAGDDVLAGAILDRLLHSATVLNIQGRSYRLKDLEASLGRSASTATNGGSDATQTG
ncbi:MAG: ATP-binding protein [Planctomycetaceae bacterium]|nr:ATP-binding protein [Planctomycetaceae bacterium]